MREAARERAIESLLDLVFGIACRLRERRNKLAGWAFAGVLAWFAVLVVVWVVRQVIQ